MMKSELRSITLYKDAKDFEDDEVVIFRVKKTSVEGRDKVILQEEL